MAKIEHLASLYQRFPVNIARGKGSKVWDSGGKEYIDCMGGYGVALVGHCNDRVVDAIKRQQKYSSQRTCRHTMILAYDSWKKSRQWPPQHFE